MKHICDACGNLELIEKDGKWMCSSCGNIQEKTELEQYIGEAINCLKNQDWKKANEISDKALKIDNKCADAYLCKLLAEKECSNIDKLKELQSTFSDSKNYKAIMLSDDTELKTAIEKANSIIIEINSSFGLPETGSMTARKSAKVFSIIAGVFFILVGVAQFLMAVNFTGWSSISRFFCIVRGIVFVLLSIFLFKRNNKGITILWLIFALIALLASFEDFLYLPPHIMNAVYLLLVLLNIFQKKLLKKRWVHFIVFLLPIIYGSSLINGFVMIDLVLCFFGMIFYLLYLVSANKIKKVKAKKEK